MKAGYSVPIGGPVLLGTGVAKTVVGALAPAQFGLDWLSFSLGFDGTNAVNGPVQVELCACTFATNAPGTNSTSVTPQQEYGLRITPGFTGAYAWLGGNEPTVITTLERFPLNSNCGLVIMPVPRPMDCAPSAGFCIRCTAPAGVNAYGGMLLERL